jgi:hypothetical protein
MTFSSSCARSNPARPLLGLLVWSWAIRRFAASARSCAGSKSATVYCRGSGRVRFLRGPFDALLARMAVLSCFAVAIGPLRFSERTVAIKHVQRSFARPAPGHRRVSQCRTLAHSTIAPMPAQTRAGHRQSRDQARALAGGDEVGKSPDTLSGDRRDGFTHIRQARSTIRPLAGGDCFNSSVDRQVFGT